jgi:hypothetical protein
MEAATVAALVAIASFAIDRIAAATFFLLSFAEGWRESFPDPATLPDGALRTDAARKLKLVYYIFVGALALIAVLLLRIQILDALNVPGGGTWIDALFSAIVLMGGSGQIAALLGAPHAAPQSKPPPEPIQIRGSVRLEEPLPRDKRSAG